MNYLEGHIKSVSMFDFTAYIEILFTALVQPISVKVASAVMRQAVKEGREGRGGKISEILKLDGMEGIERYVRSSMYYPEYRPTVFAF